MSEPRPWTPEHEALTLFEPEVYREGLYRRIRVARRCLGLSAQDVLVMSQQPPGLAWSIPIPELQVLVVNLESMVLDEVD